MEQKKFEFNEMNYDLNNDTNSNSCNMDYMCQQNMMCSPIQECPQERVCHKYMCYEVPQD